jgi:argininosuccinate lyase
LETLDILGPALSQVKFRKDQIHMDPSINAAAEANELVVKEGIPFREAYKRIGEKYRKQ